MADVIFYEAFEEEQEALRGHMHGLCDAAYTDKTIQEAGDQEPPAPLISIRTQSRIPSAWADRLDGILSRSAGYDHLLAYRRKAGRKVPALGYLPLYCVRAVAEQAMLMWQALLRKLPRQVRQFARFHRDGITGRESLDKQLLVVGVGRIGHEIAVLGRALGMHVQGVDIEQKHDDIAYTTFEQGREHADIIVCAMNLTDQNRGYFNVRSLSLCRRGALFVNVARGEMSPPSQLLHLLREDRLGGIGLDVFAREKEIAVAFRSGTYLQDPESDALRELMKSDRVILTPHNAFNTREAVERKASQSIEQIQHFLQQKAFKWSVPT